ncbi:POK18 protein, partial [Baryphthengus martii]|nr:POK18 protein [Baryphthengus martii]
NALIYHYMDDILIATEQLLSDVDLQWLIDSLQVLGLVVAPEKIQRTAPWKYLGWLISDSQIWPQKVSISSEISTLHDAQRLLGGDIQWVRNIVGITNDDLYPLLPWLQGTDASSPHTCTPEQRAALDRIASKIR